MTAAARLIKGEGGRRFDDEALAAMGLMLENDDAAAGAIEVWPGNEKTVEVFVAMMTQWNVGMNGATGLRYEALPVVMRYARVPRADQSAVFGGLRVMEGAALEAMRDGR
jgi:hypothetical protein